MGIFYQGNRFATIHDLYEIMERERYERFLDSRLNEFARHRNIALLLPSLYSEIHVPGVLDNIIDEINRTSYISQIVIALGGAKTRQEFEEARAYFGRLEESCNDVRIVWVDGPGIQQILEQLQKRRFVTGSQGKGQSVWIALGYLFAREKSDVICLHDCDIVTYDRLLLGRLAYPVANPNNDFEFCKGFYPRVSPDDFSMKGRVTRLFIYPFLDVWIDIMHRNGDYNLENFFRFHREFFYPLAGEFCFSACLAKGINIASNWGLEVSTLSEVYRRLNLRKVVQVDIARNYEHKHQELSKEDASRGLHRMVLDIACFFFSYVRAHGHDITETFCQMVVESYYHTSLNYVKRFCEDADVNGLQFDRYMEEQTVIDFAGFMSKVWECMCNGSRNVQIPSWNRVAYSYPEIYGEIMEVVEHDNSNSR
jgi:glucosyl-3-phosphoglycerate synthase